MLSAHPKPIAPGDLAVGERVTFPVLRPLLRTFLFPHRRCNYTRVFTFNPAFAASAACRASNVTNVFASITTAAAT